MEKIFLQNIISYNKSVIIIVGNQRVKIKGRRKCIQHFIQHFLLMLDVMLDENLNVG